MSLCTRSNADVWALTVDACRAARCTTGPHQMKVMELARNVNNNTCIYHL